MRKKAAPTVYDEVPYPSHSFPQSHPDRLATLGRLFGLNPASVTACRVLELGCASGGNLIPLAFHLPDSEFVGLDFSLGELEVGREMIRRLGLRNIRLEHGDITDVGKDFGTFDYIISHGVFSWIPDPVQDRLLAVSAANLAPEGVAYVSYNTYPGWHLRGMIRHMMLYHADQFVGPEERVEQARALLDFLSGAVATEGSHFGMLLKSELELIRRCSDNYLYHDHLAETNQPVYFYQFVDRARRHALQYLAESDISTMLAGGFPDAVRRTLDEISDDIVRSEQYMDFLRARFFRQTLLCHADRSLKRDLSSADILEMLVASPVTAEKTPVNLAPAVQETFRSPSGVRINTASQVTKTAFCVLEEHWPRAVGLPELVTEVRTRLDGELPDTVERVTQALADDLLHGFASGLVELHGWQADFVTSVSDRPLVSAMARAQAEAGLPAVNQRHELARLDAVATFLVRILDGTRDHADLLEALSGAAEAGQLRVKDAKGNPMGDPDEIRQALEQSLNEALAALECGAMLVG